MKAKSASSIFESLSSELRLEIFKLLVRKGPEGMVAGELSSLLEIPPPNLSFHLKTLLQAELVTVEAEGRFQRYRANIPLMLELIAFLTEECCADHPENCLKMRAESSCSSTLLPPR